jgi:hypothetical protein
MVARYQGILRGMGNPFASECEHRRIAMSYHITGENTCFQWGVLHRSLSWTGLPASVREVWCAFLCASLDVPVHEHKLAKLHWSRRRCRKCTASQVADEKHALLECNSTYHVRESFRDRLLWPVGSLAQFVQVNMCRDLAFFVFAAWSAYKAAAIVATHDGGRPRTLADLHSVL